MDRDAYLDSLRTVAYLAGCAVREEVPDSSSLEGADSDALLDAAERHTLAAITAVALQSAGITSSRIQQEAARGMWKAAQLEADWQLVRRALEDAGIWYCPLKGAVIKDLYPAFGMRQMADYDILFDASRASDVKEIMVQLGFTCEHFGSGVHDVYHKLPVSNFEMHRKLFADTQKPELLNYYQNIKSLLLKDEDNGFGWHMSVEECYLYLVAHEYKHFSVSGTGLRSSLDIYVYLRKYQDDMDWDEVRAKARELGLEDFEEQGRLFAQNLFSEEGLSLSEGELFTYQATSGTYGTMAHRVSNKLDERGAGARGKLSYLAERVFMPLDAVEQVYPFFYRHKVLLPVLVVYRLGKALTTKRGAALQELVEVARYEKKA